MKHWWQRLNRLIESTPTQDGSLQDRLVVVDTETTGLNTRRDALLSIGAVAITQGRLQLNDSFYQVLQPDIQPSADNVLVHRLTPADIQQAVPARQAMQAFLSWAGEAPLLAYHADFDRAVVNRACKQAGLSSPLQAWLDVAHWVLLAHPDLGDKPLTLEAATAYFRLHNENRHNAHSDALSTALLVLKLLKQPELDHPTQVSELQSRIRRNHRLRSLRY